MSDIRSNDIDRAANRAMDDLLARNKFGLIGSDMPEAAAMRTEVQIALRAAAVDAYQRGASWGLQQHQPVTVNINCPHAEATL